MAWNEPGPGRDPWNSPSGGSRGGDKPPDLDALMKRVRGWFGLGGAPRGAGTGGAVVFAVLAVVIWIGSGVYSVDEQERGVILRFGAYAGTVDPGVGWHLPWPIERVERVAVTRSRSVPIRASLLTKDENLVDVELAVQFRVSSAEQYLFDVADPDGTLQEAAASALREVIASTPMSAVLGDGRQTVADAVRRRLQDRVDQYRSGLLITDVGIEDVKLPDEVKAAFDDVSKAHEDELRVKNDAAAYADSRLPAARADAARQLAEAESYKAQTIARAEGDTARFSEVLDEYRRAPEVTRDRLYLDAMSDVLEQSGKVLVDIKGNPTLYLPLDQLTRAGGHSASSNGDNGAGAAAPAAPHGPAPGAGGDDDSFRSRDRESH